MEHQKVYACQKCILHATKPCANIKCLVETCDKAAVCLSYEHHEESEKVQTKQGVSLCSVIDFYTVSKNVHCPENESLCENVQKTKPYGCIHIVCKARLWLVVDDMLLKVQGVRLWALLEDFRSRAPATSSVAVIELEIAPHARRAPLAIAISAASIELAWEWCQGVPPLSLLWVAVCCSVCFTRPVPTAICQRCRWNSAIYLIEK